MLLQMIGKYTQMKWHNIKTHHPIDFAVHLVRLEKTLCGYSVSYMSLAQFQDGWKDSKSNTDIEEDGYYVTHFCVPDPIEIDL